MMRGVCIIDFMTAVNHVLMGSVIGAGLASPVALPLAFISHYLLDMLPHYGIATQVRRMDDHVWKLDLLLCAALTAYLVFFINTDLRLWMLLSAFLAVIPDFAWVYRFVVFERFGTLPPKAPTSFINTLHADIQKHESPDKLWVEVVVFFGLLCLFVAIV
jgi:hypothetical protein